MRRERFSDQRATRITQLVLGILTSAVAMPAGALDVLIANGSAPPNPANVLDHGGYAEDYVHVRNLGCPPVWPGGLITAPCPSPGATTRADVTAGGVVGFLWVSDSSQAEVRSGTIQYGVIVEHAAAIDVHGGTVAGTFSIEGDTTASIHGGTFPDEMHAVANGQVTIFAGALEYGFAAFDTARIELRGGDVRRQLASFDQAVVEIVGTDFQIDGVPVPYGVLATQSGAITGTLASGDPLDALVWRGAMSGTDVGTILLVEAGPARIPVATPFGQLLLCVALLGAGIRAFPDSR